MSPTSILPLIITERAYVARVAPHNAKTVLIATSGILSTATRAEQNDGQNIHKAALPSNANSLLLLDVSTLISLSFFVVNIIVMPSAKYAPKACIITTPAVSKKALIGITAPLNKNHSLMAYNGVNSNPISRYCEVFILPSGPPIAIRRLAAANSANNSMDILVIDMFAPEPHKYGLTNMYKGKDKATAR